MNDRSPSGGGVRRGLIEFCVIATGVLVALIADGWREDRIDRTLEAEYVERLASDLQSDTAALGRGIRSLRGKEADLRDLLFLDPRDSSEDMRQFASTVASASAWSWNFTAPNAATFEEMRSSGRLGLISDEVLRGEVVRYYAWFSDTQRTIDARRTDFGPLGYQLVLRRTVPGNSPTPVDDFAPAEDAPRIMAQLLDDDTLRDLRRSTVAEINYSRWASARASQLLESAEVLLKQLGR